VRTTRPALALTALLYPLFAGADVDFIIGGQIARIPDFRPRLKEITAPVMVLAGRYDRALYPQLQRQFTEYAPRIRLEFLERSGSFSHVQETRRRLRAGAGVHRPEVAVRARLVVTWPHEQPSAVDSAGRRNRGNFTFSSVCMRTGKVLLRHSAAGGSSVLG